MSSLIEQYNERWAELMGEVRTSPIGVSCHPEWKPRRKIDTVLRSAEALMQVGARPQLLTMGQNPAQGPADVAAIVFPGGTDLHPSTYGEVAAGTKMSEVDLAFDNWELDWARHALDTGLPMLGSCRGAHVMNVAAGGTLVQDLHSPVTHDGSLGPVQHIQIEPGSTLAQVFGLSALVNSRHHQGVAKLAPIYTVTARSNDGLVEAFERIGKPEHSAYQFHPEILVEHDARYYLLYQRLVSQARAWHERELNKTGG